MSTEKKTRKERDLRTYRFTKDWEKKVVEHNLDRIKGQGSLILSIIEFLPKHPFTSRDVSTKLIKHPEYRTKFSRDTAGGIPPEQRITSYWLWTFRKLGVIEIVEEAY